MKCVEPVVLFVETMSKGDDVYERPELVKRVLQGLSEYEAVVKSLRICVRLTHSVYTPRSWTRINSLFKGDGVSSDGTSSRTSIDILLVMNQIISIMEINLLLAEVRASPACAVRTGCQIDNGLSKFDISTAARQIARVTQ